jgi:hypothetical protein
MMAIAPVRESRRSGTVLAGLFMLKYESEQRQAIA